MHHILPIIEPITLSIQLKVCNLIPLGQPYQSCAQPLNIQLNGGDLFKIIL